MTFRRRMRPRPCLPRHRADGRPGPSVRHHPGHRGWTGPSPKGRRAVLCPPRARREQRGCSPRLTGAARRLGAAEALLEAARRPREKGTEGPGARWLIGREGSGGGGRS